MKKPSDYYLFFLKGTVLIITMLLIRAYYTHGLHYLFLLWNLFLAFIPFQISSFLSKKDKINKIQQLICFLGWLFFFPNAPYIITDLIHLVPNKQMPVWYDAVLIFVAALNGLCIGCISLMQMERLWLSWFPTIRANFFLSAVMLLSGFGVYLGRFLRFNTWDVIMHPFSLLHVTYKRVLFPWQYIFTWEITLFFSIILFVSYYQLKNLVK